MIGICAKCGNYEWDKTVRDNEIICPKCGNRWPFVKLPLGPLYFDRMQRCGENHHCYGNHTAESGIHGIGQGYVLLYYAP